MNLVIGFSQLSHYFPKDYIRISSRNIDFNYLKNNSWDSVYITFSEQRIYDSNIDYIAPNYLYTLEIINSLIKNSNKIICYTSCELWNKLSGPIDVHTKPEYYPPINDYILSKILLLNDVIELRKTNPLYNKVVFIHPFYFNSVYRNEYFLFGKIFQSIIQKKKINVGNLDFERDMVHAKFVVEKSIETKQDLMVGAGKLFNARKFIQDLYEMNNMNFDYFVQEDKSILPSGIKKSIMAKVNWNYSYEDLLHDTQNDIKQFKEK